jgi:hypothetical protein
MNDLRSSNKFQFFQRLFPQCSSSLLAFSGKPEFWVSDIKSQLTGEKLLEEVRHLRLNRPIADEARLLPLKFFQLWNGKLS